MQQISRLLLSTALFVTSAQAQSLHPDWQGGFRAAAGLGYGSAGLSCSGCGTSRDGSPAFMLRFGGGVHPGIVLGGELTGWSKSTSDATGAAVFMSFVTQWYPQPSQGFYVEGGIGAAGLDATIIDPNTGSYDARTTSLGLQGGMGYDIGVHGRFAVTPYATFLYAVPADVKVNGSSSGVSMGVNMLHVGVAATWR